MIVYPFIRIGGTTYKKGKLQLIMTGRFLLGIILYFSGPWGLNHTKKDPFEFSLVCSDSLNMNYTEFYFIGLVKLNIERPFFGSEPLLYQVRKTYEFGLVRRMS